MTAQLISLLVHEGGWVVFGATLLSRLGLPVPGAPFMVVAGAMVALGRLSPWTVLPAAVVASVLGDGAWFLIGRHQGYRILRTLCRLSISPDSCVSQSETFIGRWGGASLVAAKFVPGVSVVAPPVAGALGMPMSHFLAWQAAGALAWSVAFALIGFVFATQIDAVLAALSTLGTAAGIGLVVLFAAYLAFRLWKRHSFLHSVESARITVDELRGLMDEGRDLVIFDVRSATGRAMDPRSIPGSRPLEMHAVDAVVPTLPEDHQIVVWCNCPNEASAAQVARRLAAKGRTRVKPLLGGLDAWAAAGHPVVVPRVAAAA
jgi:membrane protein DedA with SNARE-associated domain/rhodanese-related sulfurtransferase